MTRTKNAPKVRMPRLQNTNKAVREEADGEHTVIWQL